MRVIDRRAVTRRFMACVVAVVLCLGPAMTGVYAQAPSISSAGEAVLLRDQPGYDAAVLATLGDGNALDVTGEPVTAADGTSWLPVVAGGQSGYVPAGYVPAAPAGVEPALAPELVPDPVAAPSISNDPAVAPGPATTAPVSASAAFTTTDANLRSGPSADSGVLLVLPPGTPVSIDGPVENGFAPVTGNGGSGWVAAELLAEDSAATAPPPVSDPTTPFTATAMSDVVMYPAPDRSSGVLTVVPAGSALNTTGGPQNGYFPVDYGGQAGWVEGVALSLTGSENTSIAPASGDVSAPIPTTATAPEFPGPAPAVATSESTGIAWPFSGGEWEVVQGYNNGTHTNRSGFAQYKFSLDWARVAGDTAGQPVFAPVSGTIQWVDRGSGGMLVDAGNGYGVAVFHATLDRGLARGGSVVRGQQIGTISGPGGDGYMSMAHIDITVWQLNGRAHEAVPFTGPNAIAGQEFPDTGGTNQHMGARVAP